MSEAFTSQEIEEQSKAETGYAQWKKRQEEHDQREKETHDLRTLDVNSVIRHRGSVEGFLASQVEVQKEYNRLAERMANAMERIAASLEAPVKILASSMEEKP